MLYLGSIGRANTQDAEGEGVRRRKDREFLRNKMNREVGCSHIEYTRWDSLLSGKKSGVRMKSKAKTHYMAPTYTPYAVV